MKVYWCLGAETVKKLIPALVEKLEAEEDARLKVSSPKWIY